ncbi:uncharacterized protein B0I36DRAFT_348240 [Microdochium trichocladiopsis]|uniref:Uncharacterized protein n=1 Tax=Microdochium trichocladiopsis TaxID=1682393 RepID=A0A9P8YBM7_9PEZI|nr:uncharacterized protein B0I36DRAFT_348240 [Microdochium trichocladiopsis]KAH7033143.1 hypothetical protein B0I36DRAFT_348240 [Microdochium trichocladiopsis]
MPDTNGSLARTNLRLLQGGEYSDATVKCGDRTMSTKLSSALGLCGSGKLSQDRSRNHRQQLSSSKKCSQNESNGYSNGSMAMVRPFSLGSRPDICPRGLVLTITTEYDLEDHSAWADNIFVATAQSYAVADYFLLRRLKVQLTENLINESSDIIAMFQKRHKGTHDDKCKKLYGKNILYSPGQSNDFLREVYVEFVVRAWSVLQQYPEYAEGIKREAAFGADVLIAVGRGYADYAALPLIRSCEDCGTDVFENGRHIARPILAGSRISCICNACFKWESR